MSRVGVFALVCLLCMGNATGEVIHREKSLYQNIEIQQKGDDRCLVFAVRRDDRRQSCFDTENPDRVVFSYVRMTFGGLLLQPNPSSILIVGLGGGTLPTALNALYPTAQIDVVEIDAAVVRVAEGFFNFKANDQLNVAVQDARVFIKRAARLGSKYDLVILDAFTGEYIPEHLMTREFLAETRALLSEGGVVVANTFSSSQLYDYESQTYKAVFNEFFNFKLPSSGNRIIIARDAALPPRGELTGVARSLAPSVGKFGVPLLEYPSRLSTRVDWDMSRRALTDQYSPSNLLRDN